MTQVFKEDGTVVPVTRVQAGPCQITKLNTGRVNSVQIGFGDVRAKNLNKPQVGHLKDLELSRSLREFRVEDGKEVEKINKGDKITVTTFVEGDKVSVTGTSKGKGFQGVVKRHGFKGGPASHGHKDQLRMPGSIGATGPQKVFKGTRMAGRMGGDQVTVKNLEIIKIDADTNDLFIKGAVPGAREGLLSIKADGELKIAQDKVEETKEEPKKEDVTKEEVKTEEVVKEKKEEQKSEVKAKVEDSKEVEVKEEKVEEKKEKAESKKEEVKTSEKKEKKEVEETKEESKKE